MLVESLLGSVLGGAFRIVPEVLKFMDRKNEREHELSMAASSLEADKARYGAQLATTTIQTEAAVFEQATGALQEALKGQFQLTGNVWLDALNMSVRPVVTYWFFLLYTTTKWAAWQSGAPVWTDGDMALFSGILNFYFLGRVFDRVRP